MNPLLQLHALGQSVWLDDLHRRMLIDGSLAQWLDADGVCGITSNPSTFSTAIMGYEEYEHAVTAQRGRKATAQEVYEELVLEDVRRAADLLAPAHLRSEGNDGFVSLEVSPFLAYDAPATIAEGRRLWKRVDRPNLTIKVPGTLSGLKAVSALIADGINVNVTLLFSPARYQAVIGAHCDGLEQRLRRGENLESVASVASFFLSRIDTHVDRLLDELSTTGREADRWLRGRTAIACACRAYELHTAAIASDRWKALARSGARMQRLLWASTSAKDPSYADVKYVEELIAPGTVTTLPAATLSAYREHGRPEPRFETNRAVTPEVLDRLAASGLDIEEISQQLELEGVARFSEPYQRVLQWLDGRLAGARAQR